MYVNKILKCHGTGIFASMKSNISKGKIGCDCSNSSKKTKYQYTMKVYEKCNQLGYTFLGFYDSWDSVRQKGLVHLKMHCKKHGYWNTTSIDNLLFHDKACNDCGNERIGQSRLFDDNIHINDFLSTGKYHPCTKFWRSKRLNNHGHPIFWFYKCPVCGDVCECQQGNLKSGKVSCSCNGNNQQQCYINLVLDSGVPIALKYGIANNYTTREKSQNKHSIYDVNNCGVWEFESVTLCKSAEAECKRTFSHVLDAREMKDGYTETTSPLDIDKIIEIYENWGGVRIK